jgi:hypothetical protein
MMSVRKADAEAASQYLIWALEEIEKIGNQKAAHHARLALAALRSSLPGDKADEQAT